MSKYLLFMLILTAQLSYAQNFTKVDNQDGVQEEIISASESIQTLNASFSQEKHMSILDNPFISKGNFYYKQTNKVRWEYLNPFSYTVILHDGHVKIKDGEDIENYNLSNNTIFREINDIISGMMNGKMLEDKSFKTELFESSSQYKAVLIPQISSMRNFIEEVHLYFDKETKLVSKVEMLEKGGDKTVIILSDYKVNSPISEDVFKDI